MNNDPNQPTAITSGGIKPLKSSGKTPNLKIFGIGAAVALVLAAVIIFLLLPKDTPVRAGEFNDNASSSREVSEVNNYVSLEGFELDNPLLSPYDAEEAESKIIDFFSYTYPEISVLTVKDLKKEESSPSSEISDEENPASSAVYTYTLTGNNGKTFLAEISFASNLAHYSLSITTDNKELYSYKGGEIESDLYDRSTETLLDAIISKLPLSGEVSGEKFDITYEGDVENRLTLSAASDNDVLENCDAIKSAAAALVSNLTLDYSGEISEKNFICE